MLIGLIYNAPRAILVLLNGYDMARVPGCTKTTDGVPSLGNSHDTSQNSSKNTYAGSRRDLAQPVAPSKIRPVFPVCTLLRLILA